MCRECDLAERKFAVMAVAEGLLLCGTGDRWWMGVGVGGAAGADTSLRAIKPRETRTLLGSNHCFFERKRGVLVRRVEVGGESHRWVTLFDS